MIVTMDDYWADVADRHGDIHLRDVQAHEDRRERARRATGWTQSDGVHPLTKGWAAYNQATYGPIRDIDGREHLVTLKQYKVYLWAMGEIAMDRGDTTLRAIGSLLGVCPQTVSNALRRFMSWGVLAYLSSKGKYGGLSLFRRTRGDGMDHYARMARAAITALWQRKIARLNLKSNVHTWANRVGSRLSTTPNLDRVDIRMRDDRIEAVLQGFVRGTQRRVPCPAHEGEGRNLSFWRRQDGSLGVKCWSHQCTTHAIKDAVEPWPVG